MLNNIYLKKYPYFAENELGVFIAWFLEYQKIDKPHYVLEADLKTS